MIKKNLEEILELNNFIINTSLDIQELFNLRNQLVDDRAFCVIVDDYPETITDKLSLLRSMCYQLNIINMHNDNWDALEEGLFDVFSIYRDYKKIVLIFKNIDIKQINLIKEIQILNDIILDYNSQENNNKIYIIYNNQAKSLAEKD